MVEAAKAPDLLEQVGMWFQQHVGLSDLVVVVATAALLPAIAYCLICGNGVRRGGHDKVKPNRRLAASDARAIDHAATSRASSLRLPQDSDARRNACAPRDAV